MKRCTDITMILDRSWSMTQHKDRMEEAINGFIADQKKLNVDECNFTLYTFDNVVELALRTTNIQNVGTIEIHPRGSTALIEAVGRGVIQTGERLAQMAPEARPDRVMVIIVTDGGHNTNIEMTKEQVTAMVRHQKDVYSWNFLYLGANQDVIENAADVGIDAGATLNFSTDNGANNARGASYVGRSMSLASNAVRISANNCEALDMVDYAASLQDEATVQANYAAMMKDAIKAAVKEEERVTASV